MSNDEIALAPTPAPDAEPPKKFDTLSRRSFLATFGAAVLGSAAPDIGSAVLNQLREATRRKVPGELLGPSHRAGHLLRDPGYIPPAATRHSEVELLIIGGGASGIAAAWRLSKRGFKHFRLLELEPETGGNSRAGTNRHGIRNPWGAHYLPLPGRDSHYVRELLEEAGAIRGYQDGLPLYDETLLCRDPDERLFIHGRWQEGLIPELGIPQAERTEIRRFLAEMESFRNLVGKDGKPAFTLPMHLSSQDPALLALDRMSFLEWLGGRGYHAPSLLWYLNYGTRDDYGTRIEEVSAWAGIHYFAGRKGLAANAESDDVLTWPEGNDWLIQQMLRKIPSGAIETGKLVLHITREQDDGSRGVDVLDLETHAVEHIQARGVIFAAPQFAAARVLEDLKGTPPHPGTYAPWAVAAVSLARSPDQKGLLAESHWDSVPFGGASLGYISNRHQEPGLRSAREPDSITWYRPLDHLPPREARRWAQERSHEEWSEEILTDLARMHPGVRNDVERIDIWIWGHAMMRPVKGLLWSTEQRDLRTPRGARQSLMFAHSDVSGLSLFEEAQAAGVIAADHFLTRGGI